jgi:transposase
MPNFYPYNPEQAYLLPPSVRDVLSENHLSFFVSRSVEQLDLSGFEQGYSEEGHPAYHPALMLKVWLYAYALGITSSRRLEQRVREDLAFRYLAGGAQPDFWALNEFRKRHGRALNDAFTQVVETARSLGMGKLGHVAIDSTTLAANASLSRMETETKLRAERAQIRRRIRNWQQQCDAEDPNEAPGTALGKEEMKRFQERLAEIPQRLERLRKAGVQRLSKTDEDSRVLRERRGFSVGYRVSVAVSEDHLIVAQQVGQERADNGLLVPMTDAVERECGQRPQRVLADAGFFSVENLQQMSAREIDAYVPDSHLARELSRGVRVRGHAMARQPAHRRMRQKLRSPAGRAIYHRRKEIVEPVFGVLKEQRGMRRFRYRGLAKVAIEFTLAAMAYNLTRMWNRTVRP